MSECALIFIDYQDHVLDVIFAQDRRVIELNVLTLAKMALAFKIPVILSTVGVEMGANGPTIDSLRAVLPKVQDIDRSTMNAWDDPKRSSSIGQCPGPSAARLEVNRSSDRSHPFQRPRCSGSQES